jgi:ankyrin repeat protein
MTAVTNIPNLTDLNHRLFERITARAELVREMLDRGADPNARDAQGYSALYYAAAANEDRTVSELLLDRGASLDCTHPITGTTVLHCFSRNNWADLTARAIKASVAVDTPDAKGETALMAAVRAWASWSLEVLLDSGAQPNCQSACGDTPLHLAPYRSAVELLVSAGADIHVRNRKGETPLASRVAGATTLWDTEVAEALLEAGANPNEVLENGRTLIAQACALRQPFLVLALIEHGADPAAPMPSGERIEHLLWKHALVQAAYGAWKARASTALVSKQVRGA